MDTSKAIKTSQFSFDSLLLANETSRPKAGSKTSNVNGHLPPPERPRLAPLTAQIKVSASSVQEKLRPWKNSSPLPGLYNEKKTIHPNMKPQSKKVPFKIAPSSPLTGVNIPTPLSGQLPGRQADIFLPKSKGFRVRTGSSLAKVQTDNSSMRTTSRRNHRDSSLQRDLSLQRESSANSLDTSDLTLERVRHSDLARASVFPVSHHRENLPLLIIHFEGIIGTCLVQVKEENKDVNASRNKDEPEILPFFIRKGVKNDLKALSKSFLIIVILPSLENKYKKVTKFLVSNKFHIDGIYHNIKEEKIGELRKIEDFTLNYNVILEDFWTRIIDRKIFILLPVNLNPRIVRTEFVHEDPNEKFKNRHKTRSYEEKQFLYFFPKIKTNLNYLKIICVPNFTMSDRNERPAILLKSSFTGITKMVEAVYQEMLSVALSQGMDKHNQKHPVHLLSLSLQQIDTKREHSDEAESNKDIEETRIGEDHGNKTQRTDNNGIYAMDLEGLLGKVEEALEKSRKWRKIKMIKLEKGAIPAPENPFEFDLAPMKQAIIDGLIEGMRLRDIPRGNIMHHFLVGDLFSRNNYMFKFYEKSDYYSKRVKEQINGIVKFVKGLPQKEEKGGWMQKRDKMTFESAPSKASTAAAEMTSKGTEDETEAINLLLIRRQAKTMQVYLGD